jgi:stage II sporulation protein D
VNEVGLEDYLRGVVPAEMPSWFEMEALKAQAIAARTYAGRGMGRHAAEGFNLCDGVCCQVYGGAAGETGKTDDAVAATKGAILTYDGRPIVAMYHSDCGGITESATNVGLRDGIPYLASAPDSPESGGPEFCANGHAHRWTAAIPADGIARALRRQGEGVGVVRKVTVLSRDETGRVGRLHIDGAAGSATVAATSFRMACGSTRLKSTNFTVTKSGRAFVFRGIGYGHGLGMCQYGANGRASAPHSQSCEEILAHYYPGTQLERRAESAPALLPQDGVTPNR